MRRISRLKRGAAWLGGAALPVITAPLPVDNLFQIGPLSKKVKASGPLGRKFVAGSITGGAGAAVLTGYDLYRAYQSGWRVGQKRVNIPGGSNFVRVPRIYKKSNRGSGRKSGLGGPTRGPKTTNRFARRRRKFLRRVGRKCPNGYRYDPKRKMCVYKGL